MIQYLFLYIMTCPFYSLQWNCNRIIMTNETGVITTVEKKHEKSNPGVQCEEWMIQGKVGTTITIKFLFFDTEFGYESFFVFDGNSSTSKLVLSMSGRHRDVSITSSKNQIYLYFYTESSKSSFLLVYSINSCPNNCSDSGICSNGKCNCKENQIGTSCEFNYCPNNCSILGGNKCDQDLKSCVCGNDFFGESCSIPYKFNNGLNSWYTVSSKLTVFTARSSHVAVFISNCLIIHGGFTNDGLSDQLIYFNISTNQWKVISINEPKPGSRYDHAGEKYEDGFLIFGGELADGSFSNELWYFNNKWILLSNDKSIPGLTGHSVTVVGSKVFIFGGRIFGDKISSTMYIYNIIDNVWKVIEPMPVLQSRLKLVGHTASYYKEKEIILIYGGLHFTSKNAKSGVSNDMFAFSIKLEKWSIWLLPESSSPALALHSAVISDNHLILHGGWIFNADRNEPEPSNATYFYNLMCLLWVSYPLKSNGYSLKKRYGHTALMMDMQTVIIVGGFNGAFLLNDVLVLKIPFQITGLQCFSYLQNKDKCLSDPSCIYCSSCVPYYQKNICSDPILKPYLCQDQCSFLSTCEECTAYTQCNWCTLTSFCQSKENKNCFQEQKLWWGSNNGILINATGECQLLDEPPGITYMYYLKPENFNYPDYVKVLPHGKSIIYNVTSKATLILKGAIYPFFRFFNADFTNHKVLLRGRNLNATLSLSSINGVSNLVEVVSLPFDDQYHEVVTVKNPIFLYNKVDRFQTQNLKYTIELKANLINLGSDQYAAIEIQWNHTDNEFFALYPIPGSYLQPFKTTNCSQYFSCSGCVSDMFCGWCDTVLSCMPRSSWSLCFNISAGYLVRNQSQCMMCKHNFDCESCKKDFFCDWDEDLLKCTRKELVHASSNCSSCNKKSTIEECLTVKHCIWCSEKKKCLYNFQVAMQNKYGECRTVYDGYMLQNCSTITNCSSCLNAFHCGWCYDFIDPRVGRCTIGDFSGPIKKCQIVTIKSEPAWSYEVCPDINECALNIFSCDINAYCVNTMYSYECKCKQGYIGDGKSKCIKTCWPECYQGVCNETTYKCECNLGWTGQNCSVDCGCNGHSTCLYGVGICDQCQENTVGKYCEKCINGSYGNALTSTGCKKCECNGHGNPLQNYCQSANGECFCLHNTIGSSCELCEPGFVGNPRNNGICYIPCKRSSIISNLYSGYLSPTNEANNLKYTTCVWLISPRNLTLNEYIYSDPLQFSERILISITKINLTSCFDSQLFVYDGIPPNPRSKKVFIKTSFKKLGRLCGVNSKKVFRSSSGMLSLVYEGQTSKLLLKQDNSNFLIMFQILQCPDHCPPPYICSVLGICSCKDGFYGNKCEYSKCINNCNAKKNQGTCIMDTYCLCKVGFAGEDCSQLVSNLFWQISTMPIHSSAIENVEDKRFAGTMVIDDSFLYIFGGRNFSDLKSPDVFRVNLLTGYKEMLNLSSEVCPSSRYFHCSFFYKKEIYIYGGITSSGFSNEIWKFNPLKKVWTDLTRNFSEKKVAGHTCTLFGDVVYIIGGYYWIDGYSIGVRLIELNTLKEQYQKFTGPTPSALYGHVSVYYPEEKKIVVHGGIEFYKNKTKISNQVYIFDPENGYWNLVESKPANSSPFIFGHSGHMINGTLFIISGYDDSVGFNNDIYIWRPVCNLWSFLQRNDNFVRDTGNTNMLFALSAIFNNTILLYGGFNYNVNGKLIFFSVPRDICAYQETKLKCLSEISCSWCSKINDSFCFDKNVKSCSENISMVTSSMSCSVDYERECSSYTSCSSCLSSYPKYSGCKWCQESYCASNSSSCLTTFNEISQCITKSRQFQNYCVDHTTCDSCLNEQVFEDFSSPGCLWSEKLSTCVSYSLLPLKCSFGSCGQLHSKEMGGQCPILCELQKDCISCTKLAHCGWCADNHNGSGKCLKGDIEGPTNSKCEQADYNTFIDNTDMYAKNKTWVFIVCPLENECESLDKPCNLSELCIDKDIGFECHCQPGYRRLSSNLQGESCVPVCESCINGKCIEPNKCNCSFGWTGIGCNVPCQCNGHSNCANETHTSICLDCMHNTIGSTCDKCKPLYVGDPTSTSGLNCQECRSVCNNNTDICMTKEDFVKYKHNIMSFSHGPKSVDDVKCYDCQNNSEGDLCDSCIDGFFKILNGPCQLCQCNNHSNTCNKSTGEECQCYHNTETSLNCKKECYKEQCTRCIFGFSGNPMNGRQCYEKIVSFIVPKQRTMLSARSSFFMISPYYMNVNMRIVIDVIEGELDMYFADSDEYFIVSQNATQIQSFSVIFGPRNENSKDDDYTPELSLSSEMYFTVTEYFGNVLSVKNIRKRILITVKHSVHDLSKKNFYIAVSTINKPDSAFFIYYSQDLVRLNLTLFVLILIVCLLIIMCFALLFWKASQLYMQGMIIGEEELALKTMGTRPFGTYKIFCQNLDELVYKRRTKQNLQDSVTPLAIQNTKDNLASVIVVIVQFPSNELTECFCLGSGLTLAHNQYLLETASNIGTHGRLVNTRILSTVA
ncbi:multiple epidermal growth factor-like domains protein 8 isoform X1 [Hydra vulgaris]|uniref:multiple epidermal growth factor-like domains protein 8 isoform X1 n=1 Tax=Hydra vulgaris TaxID=6087 RepID=UPI001F5E76B0|nr:multiple epidermal growth factor-like domains protein 8 [Hydra vulgaris]